MSLKVHNNLSSSSLRIKMVVLKNYTNFVNSKIMQKYFFLVAAFKMKNYFDFLNFQYKGY